MFKIGILNQGPRLNWGKNFGYWYFVKFFQNELKDLGFDINFFDIANNKFYNSDIILINNRIFSDTFGNKLKEKLGFKTSNNYLENLEKISKLNNNIVWLDLSDSCGTTSFEVLPYVKKYVKKQYYKNKDFYRLNFYRNRYYADYYQSKYQIEENIKFNYCQLLHRYENKLILGWNIGVGCYFNNFNYSKFKKYQCILNLLYNNNFKELSKFTLGFYNDNFKSKDIFYSFNLRKKNQKKAIHLQRQLVNNILSERFKVKQQRLTHKNYLIELRKSKVSVGAFGWGEVCYREFEAIKMGSAVIFPNVDYMETWPNIYQDNISYVSYKLDLSDLLEKIEIVVNDNNLRLMLLENSQSIIRNIYLEDGLNFLINFFNKVCK